jgi:hypothetical protein
MIPSRMGKQDVFHPLVFLNPIQAEDRPDLREPKSPGEGTFVILIWGTIQFPFGG